jgi:hypothetical protein
MSQTAKQIYDRARYEKNRAKILERRRKYHEKNRARLLQQMRDKRAATHDARVQKYARKLQRRALAREQRHEADRVKRQQKRERAKKHAAIERKVRMFVAQRAVKARFHRFALLAPNSWERTKMLALVPDFNVEPIFLREPTP